MTPKVNHKAKDDDSKKDDDVNLDATLIAYIESLRRSSPTKQLIVGALGGYVSGFIVAKVGKATLFGIGISVVALHYAERHGYVKINTKKINKDMEAASKEIKKNIDSKLPKYIEKSKRFLLDNGYLSLGYGSGFFLGLTSN